MVTQHSHVHDRWQLDPCTHGCRIKRKSAVHRLLPPVGRHAQCDVYRSHQQAKDPSGARCRISWKCPVNRSQLLARFWSLHARPPADTPAVPCCSKFWSLAAGLHYVSSSQHLHTVLAPLGSAIKLQSPRWNRIFHAAGQQKSCPPGGAHRRQARPSTAATAATAASFLPPL